MVRLKEPPDPDYRMPAEWEPHEATWLAWPHNNEDWPSKFSPIPWVYAEIIRHLTRFEQVRLLVLNRSKLDRIRSILVRSGVIELDRVEFLHFPTDRGWLRDSGPLFIRNRKGAVGITNWVFNGWAKYNNWKRDNLVPNFAAQCLKMPHWEPGIVLEGGSIDVNGEGCLLTTEECLLGPVQTRNPGLSREEIESALATYLGVKKVLWLGRGIAGDDTHGHIDDIARFVNPTTVVAAVETNREDPNYEPLQENLERLRQMTDQDGRPLDVVTIPMPHPVYFDSQLLPASYANFYIANNLVLVPTFNDSKDPIALQTLAELFPDREVVGIYCRDLVLGLGTIHCMTQQEPAGIRPK